MFLDPATTISVLEVATGFFFIMWLVAATRKKAPKQRKWYRTEMPSTYIIEQEA